MDELETRLRDDALRIRAEVSPDLEARIRASLEGAASEPARRERRPGVSLWWASSLTGLAAAALVIVAINLGPEEPRPARDAYLPEPLVTPVLKVESAVLTGPLEEELEDLEADLQKARDVVRKDIGLSL